MNWKQKKEILKPMRLLLILLVIASIALAAVVSQLSKRLDITESKLVKAQKTLSSTRKSLAKRETELSLVKQARNDPIFVLRRYLDAVVNVGIVAANSNWYSSEDVQTMWDSLSWEFQVWWAKEASGINLDYYEYIIGYTLGQTKELDEYTIVVPVTYKTDSLARPQMETQVEMVYEGERWRIRDDGIAGP